VGFRNIRILLNGPSDGTATPMIVVVSACVVLGQACGLGAVLLSRRDRTAA
jgi:hypothetical protein